MSSALDDYCANQTLVSAIRVAIEQHKKTAAYKRGDYISTPLLADLRRALSLAEAALEAREALVALTLDARPLSTLFPSKPGALDLHVVPGSVMTKARAAIRSMDVAT